jgi:hypothetical protein
MSTPDSTQGAGNQALDLYFKVTKEALQILMEVKKLQKDNPEVLENTEIPIVKVNETQIMSILNYTDTMSNLNIGQMMTMVQGLRANS